MVAILNYLDGLLWGTPFIVFVVAVGIYFTVGSKFFAFRHFGHIFKNTVLKATDKEANATASGQTSPYTAFCVALGGAVGTANISGVATAIATGGPGAIFWMWLWAFVGMMVKIVETSIGLYYRVKDENGEYNGAVMHYMERGIAGEMGLKFGIPLAFLFAVSLFVQFIQGSGAYTIAETMEATFGINIMVVGIVYTAFVAYLIFRGRNAIGDFATKLVPPMCMLYLLGTLIIILVNFKAVPGAFAEIIGNAFTGRAATGGFVGASVAVAMRKGIARSVYSNEAGMGTSPLIHGQADTIHPVRQGLWGAMEVFCDTIVVATCTALAIIVTGVWTSGDSGAALAVSAFSTLFGKAGNYFIGIMTVLFGLTTTTTWYLYYQSTLEYLFRKAPKAKRAVCKAFQFIFPATMIGVVSFIYFTGSGPETFWTLISVLTAPSTFFNCFGLLVIRKKFWTLLKDYNARYLGIGEVDPNFYVFAEDDPKFKESDEKLRQMLQAKAR